MARHIQQLRDWRIKMTLEPPAYVRATRDIRRFRTVVAKCGALGTIVAVEPDVIGLSFTVDFRPAGLAGATITVRRLGADDLQTVR